MMYNHTLPSMEFLMKYSLCFIKSAILDFFTDKLVVVWKDFHVLIYLSHAVSFDMQFKLTT